MRTRSSQQNWVGLRSRRGAVQVSEQQLPPPHLGFRSSSRDLSYAKPGYYLILLRNKLRHRALRRSCSVMNEG